MKKTLWWIIGLAASPFLLFLILTLLLYCPLVQRWAVGIATQYASEETGMEISIEDVRLRFPLDLKLGGVLAIAHPYDSLPQVKDTLINAESVVCNVQLCPLFDGNVQVDILQLDNVHLNTSNLISDCRVKGRVGRLLMKSHGIDLRRDTLMLDKAVLSDADLDVCLSDTAKEDTIEKPNPDWIIKYQSLDVLKTKVLVHMPGDTLNVSADIGTLSSRNGSLNLSDEIYEMATIDLNDSEIKYDNRFETKVKGFDVNHLCFSELNVGVDSVFIRYPDISLKLRAGSAKEKSGLHLSRLTGGIQIDSTMLAVDDFILQTTYNEKNPYSEIKGKVKFDFNTLDSRNPGTAVASLDAQLGKKDVMLLAGSSLPNELVVRWPDAPVSISGTVSGNMKRCALNHLKINVPTLANAIVTGSVANLDNPNQMNLNADLNVQTAGNNGKIQGVASVALGRMEYSANLDVNNLNIDHFLPGKGLGRFSGTLNAKGRGTDVFSPTMSLVADARIRSFKYGQFNLAGAALKAKIANGILTADATTVADIMNTNLAVRGKILKNTIDATVSADLKNVDFFALRLTDKPLKIALNGGLSIKTDLKDNYSLQGRVGNICIVDTARTFTPNDIVVDLFTRRDSTHADIVCGDFVLNGSFGCGYKKLMSVGDNLIGEINRQLTERVIDETALRAKLPTGCLSLKSGRDNPLARMSNYLGAGFANFDSDLCVSKEIGINGYVRIDTLMVKDMQFDDVDLTLIGGKDKMSYTASIVNDKKNPTLCFSADISGTLEQNGTSLSVKLDDENGKRTFDVDLQAMMQQDNIRFSVTNEKPILGYRAFSVNKGNYVTLSNDMRVSADVLLRSKEGTGIQIYTEENDMVQQDVTVSISHLDLASITAAVPVMPKMAGYLDGDFHIVVDEKQTTISTDADFQGLSVEGYPMGNLATQLVYIPMEDGTHYVDGVLFKEGEEVATVKGRYYFEGADKIDADLDLTNMPMDFINGFIPDQIIGLKGIGTGKLSVTGYVSSPDINGTINMSQASLVSVPYGVELKMDSKQVEIENSKVVFNDYRLLASNNSPITVNGYFDFSDLNKMNTNLIVKGKNVEIINAKENRQSEAYGKAFVDFNGQISGLVDRLKVKATLDVLPSTNLYYILRDSPISTDNRLKELVTFTDFDDTQFPVTQRPTVNGLSMDLGINVHDGSHITCWLNGNHTNYLDIYGNGELRFTYAYEKMKMTGRYTLTEGEMKYSLPVIPLKTFNISNDSYIEFTGDVMNPTLHITATEHNKALATVDGTDTQVDFVCGVVLSKTLQDMGLEFIISSPENQSVAEYLSVMSKEERGKLAVGMLTTGMYLDQSNSNITMNTALSSFLQQEINNIAGSALKTLDLSIGFENSTTPEGTMRMDYSFKFAKRFWNNRVSVAFGGKISTGSQTAGKTPSFFDNVEVQYRLSDTSNQYLQLFYKHDVYDYLEGYLDHFGAGYMWKRKMQNLSDIFGKKQPVIVVSDSILHQVADETESQQLEQEPSVETTE